MPRLTAELPVDDDAAEQAGGTLLGILRDKSLLSHMATTGALGFALAVTLSSILYLVMTNSFFTVILSISLALTGVGLWIRSMLQVSAAAPLMNAVSRLGALAVCAASVLVLAEHYFLKNLGSWFHVVFFSSASSACSYAIAFIATNAYNSIWRDGAQFSAKQMYTLSGLSLLLGCVCGFFFAIVDVEDHIKRFGYEQWLTAALGGICGMVVGYVNHFATDDSMMFTFDPLPMDDVITPTHQEDTGHSDF
jgi:hypothetical protein